MNWKKEYLLTIHFHIKEVHIIIIVDNNYPLIVPTSAIVNTSIDVLSYTQDMIIVQFQIPVKL